MPFVSWVCSQGCTKSCLQLLVLHTPSFLPIWVCLGICMVHQRGGQSPAAHHILVLLSPPCSQHCPEMLPSCATCSLQGSREGNKREASPQLLHLGALKMVCVQWGQGGAPMKTSLTPSLPLDARWQSAKGLACLLRLAFFLRDQGLSWLHSTKLQCSGTYCGLLLEALH